MSTLPEAAKLIATIRVALIDGLNYHGHELDDVTSIIHAISAEAKKYEAGLNALDALEERTRRADVMLGTGAWVMAEQLDRVKRELAELQANQPDELERRFGRDGGDL